MDKRLAYKVICHSCSHTVVMALCRDGRWRPFDMNVELPAGTPGSWAWRKRYGMEETDLVPGHPIHYCYGAHGRRPSHTDYTVVADLPPEMQ